MGYMSDRDEKDADSAWLRAPDKLTQAGYLG